MPEILIWGLVFIGTLIVLVKASDFFIDAAEAIGLSLGIPSFIVGVTIVALGTSIPELASSIAAVQKGSTEIVIGNVVGSNITNIFLVLAFITIATPRRVLQLKNGLTDGLLLLGSAILLIVASLDKVFTFPEALMCIGGLLLYVGLQYYNYTKAPKEEEAKPPFQLINLLILAVSIVFIFLSAEWNINAIIKISEILKIGKEFIALSAVALGTSLPELFVSLAAVKKGNIEIAVGNVLGSNILNILCVMGIPGLLSALEIPPIVLNHGLLLMSIATVALFGVVITKKLPKWLGFVLLCFYGYFFFILISENLAA